MAKKKRKKKKKTSRKTKRGKLAKIKKGLDEVEKLVYLLEDCGFDATDRTFTPISELRSHAEEINDMLIKLLGDFWWRLQLPSKKTTSSENK
jgi:hypothetical protein